EIPDETTLAIADGKDYHAVNVKLVDCYGNRVISESGIKTASVKFNFDNSTKLDQIAGTGDSALFTSVEFPSLNESGTSTDFLAEAVDGDGEFELKASSFAPTSIGYPIIGLGFNLSFKSIDYKVEDIYSGIENDSFAKRGATENSFSLTSTSNFAFYPAFTATPSAYIWNDDYGHDTHATENITINATKRFNIKFENSSHNGVFAGSPYLGLILDSGENNITWKNAFIEDPSEKSLFLDINKLDGFNSSWNDMKDILGDSIAAGDATDVRMRSTPELTGTTAPSSSDALLATYVSYTIDDKEIRHKGEKVKADVAPVARIYNPGIEIIGSVRSGGGTSSKQTGAALNQSLGDIAQNEFKNGIDRNVAILTKNPAAKVCSSDPEILAAGDFDSLSCKNQGGQVFYFKNTDVTLDLSGALSTGRKTILIKGGDLRIRSNLEYPAGSANSFGVIVLKNSDGAGGNIFVYPEVTNIVGAFYAEGSLVSVNSSGECGEDTSPKCDGLRGFCDRSYELRNQLYWKGIMATQNTIGGADSSPLKFPGRVAASCPPPSCSTASASCASSEIARIYDLAYLRTFHLNSGGARAFSSSDAALVVEYDSRIQNNPPPLFEMSGGGGSNQLGSDLLKANDADQAVPKSWIDVIRGWLGW
ncbi:MAG: hypothetical protein ABIE14_05460, partial [Patescibacteria group bacterium]